MYSREFQLPGVLDENHLAMVKNHLSQLDGVKHIVSDHKTKILTVTWTEPATWEQINKTLAGLNVSPDWL